MAPKKKSKTEPPPPTKSTPNWPAFSPLVPESDLTLQHVLPGQIVTIPDFWTATLCKNYVAFLSSLPLTTTPGKPKKGDAVRVNDRFQIDDSAFAELLWSSTALKSLVTEADSGELWGGEVIGLNPNIRIYRYSKGQFFDKHCQSSCEACHLVPEMLTCTRRRLQQCDFTRDTTASRPHHLDSLVVSHLTSNGVHRGRNGLLPRSTEEEEQGTTTRTFRDGSRSRPCTTTPPWRRLHDSRGSRGDSRREVGHPK